MIWSGQKTWGTVGILRSWAIKNWLECKLIQTFPTCPGFRVFNQISPKSQTSKNTDLVCGSASHIMLPRPEWEEFFQNCPTKQKIGRGPCSLLWFAPRKLFAPGSGLELVVFLPRAVRLHVSIVLCLLCKMVPLHRKFPPKRLGLQF